MTGDYFFLSRISDVERWRKQLEKTLDEVVSEIGVLAEAKESCERALEAKALPHDVVTECLSVREGRREYEVVRDPVESSLNNENHLIEKIRSQLKVIPKNSNVSSNQGSASLLNAL